ncbi:hypothetical protein BDF22DRAFT_667398 [Syncephalis plumigaleata]|nr:hypothetical protein BDF22DRAFT_667398 [Syncephalis plumigaleata]
MRIAAKLLCVTIGLVALSAYSAASGTPDVYGDIHAANEKLGHEIHLDEKFSKADDPYYFFNLNDRNGDGWLDGHELRTAFAAEEPDATLDFLEDWVERTFKSEDKDGDNRISLHEYLLSEQ